MKNEEDKLALEGGRKEWNVYGCCTAVQKWQKKAIRHALKIDECSVYLFCTIITTIGFLYFSASSWQTGDRAGGQNLPLGLQDSQQKHITMP